jgi:hypothetical protein
LIIQPTRSYDVTIRLLIQKCRLYSQDGDPVELNSQYSFQSPVSGYFLYSMVKRFKPSKTLGIGFGYGVPALYICQAHLDLGRQNESHVVIDPTQTTHSKGIGVQSIRRAGLAHILSHRELSDFIALPMAHQMGERFQLVLIEDTRHTDYTMVDAFFADLLLDIGGFIVFVEVEGNLIGQFLATNRAYRHVNEEDIGLELMELLSMINLYVLIKQEHYDPTTQKPPHRAAVFDKIYTDNYWQGIFFQCIFYQRLRGVFLWNVCRYTNTHIRPKPIIISVYEYYK